MTQEIYDVVIAGAGPVGLLLSCELAQTGLSVLILELELEAKANWKGAPMGLRGLNTPSVELLYRRGLMDYVLGNNRTQSTFKKTEGYQSGGHFAGLGINANMIDLERFPYHLPGPALQPGYTTIERIESVLTERALALGVKIHLDEGVASILSQDDKQVTIETQKKLQYTGRYLVGCDGGRSTVRRQAGFLFKGTEATITFYAVHCEFDPPNKLNNGCNITSEGVYVLGPGPNVVYIADFDNGAFDRTREITRGHLQAVLNRIRGCDDVSIGEIYSARTFTDRSKQATQYRRGRVLLAGDAAHIHPPLGSQGLNAGFGDALNLGWKLASTIRREKLDSGIATATADYTLLDTYETERKPIGNFILEWTRSQVMILQPNLHSAAMRKLTSELIKTKDGTNHFIDLAWGLSQRCDIGEEGKNHELVGCSMPELELENGTRLGMKLHSGKGMLFEFSEDGNLAKLDEEYKDRVCYFAIPVKDNLSLQAMLVRPDGVVAWVAEQGFKTDIEAVKKALRRWFEF